MLEHRLKFREHDAGKNQTRHGHGAADTRKTGLEVSNLPLRCIHVFGGVAPECRMTGHSFFLIIRRPAVKE